MCAHIRLFANTTTTSSTRAVCAHIRRWRTPPPRRAIMENTTISSTPTRAVYTRIRWRTPPPPLQEPCTLVSDGGDSLPTPPPPPHEPCMLVSDGGEHHHLAVCARIRRWRPFANTATSSTLGNVCVSSFSTGHCLGPPPPPITTTTSSTHEN
jgi:hypothetical protein